MQFKLNDLTTVSINAVSRIMIHQEKPDKTIVSVFLHRSELEVILEKINKNKGN